MPGYSDVKLHSLLQLIPEVGLVLEFGVFKGRSIRRIARMLPLRIIYGFDAFQGLPEDWEDAEGQVLVSRGKLRSPPPIGLPKNVKLVKGWFAETLPPFLSKHRGPVAFIHIDCDVYSSAKFVLTKLRDRLLGAVILFDELRGHPAHDHNEGRAWREFITETAFSFEELDAIQPHPWVAAFRIKG